MLKSTSFDFSGKNMSLDGYHSKGGSKNNRNLSSVSNYLSKIPSQMESSQRCESRNTKLPINNRNIGRKLNCHRQLTGRYINI